MSVLLVVMGMSSCACSMLVGRSSRMLSWLHDLREGNALCLGELGISLCCNGTMDAMREGFFFFGHLSVHLFAVI